MGRFDFSPCVTKLWAVVFQDDIACLWRWRRKIFMGHTLPFQGVRALSCAFLKRVHSLQRPGFWGFTAVCVRIVHPKMIICLLFAAHLHLLTVLIVRSPSITLLLQNLCIMPATPLQCYERCGCGGF